MDNMSLSDIAAVTRNVDGDGWGAGGGWIMIILFALIFGGNGLWGRKSWTRWLPTVRHLSRPG